MDARITRIGTRILVDGRAHHAQWARAFSWMGAPITWIGTRILVDGCTRHA
jgi:hypothetical protein